MNVKVAASCLLVGLGLLAGCLPSLHPVYRDDQLIFDAQLVGKWVQTGMASRWEFAQRDATSYTLVFTDNQGQNVHFVARLADIDGTRFLDLVPDGKALGIDDNYKHQFIPIHTIFLFANQGGEVELRGIDYKWLQDYAERNSEAIASTTIEGRRILTASTEDLQAFVLKHKDKFAARLTLQRAE